MSSTSDLSPSQIVKHMLDNDVFGQRLNIELSDVKKGSCIVRCSISSEMLNSYKIAHGGVLFSLADSAIAYAAATHGRMAVTINQSISFIKKVKVGDQLVAKAETLSIGFKTGVIQVTITDKEDELVAVVRGTVYRASEEFDF